MKYVIVIFTLIEEDVVRLYRLLINQYFYYSKYVLYRQWNLHRHEEKLIKHLKNQDKEVMEMAIMLKDNKEYDFNYAFDLLFTWCQNAIITR